MSSNTVHITEKNTEFARSLLEKSRYKGILDISEEEKNFGFIIDLNESTLQNNEKVYTGYLEISSILECNGKRVSHKVEVKENDFTHLVCMVNALIRIVGLKIVMGNLEVLPKKIYESSTSYESLENYNSDDDYNYDYDYDSDSDDDYDSDYDYDSDSDDDFLL